MKSNVGLQNQVPRGLPCGQFVYCAEGDQNILYADDNVVRLFGCESYDPGTDSGVDSVLERADAAMYGNKKKMKGIE